MKINKVLVSQPKPASDKSPYSDMAKKLNVDFDFQPFIQVEGVSSKEFRQTRIQIQDHQAVIMTSKASIDHFFRICELLRITVSDDMKYYCASEAIAVYLQKYIVYRKRKIFFANGTTSNLIGLLKKSKKDKILLPLSHVHKQDIPDLLDQGKYDYTKAILYRTVSSDLSHINAGDYDIIVFFSPSGITSLQENFPDFEQGDIKIACFGPATAQAITNAGLRLDLQAPNPKAPSMTMALEQYITAQNK
ncbi:MAG: uroporphyrinogen-III synthase [Mangrovibacterium sp.]